MAWTRERLEDVARARLDGAKLVVVANREPYIHAYEGDEIRFLIRRFLPLVFPV